MIEMHRRLVLLARVALVPSRFKPAWIVGTGALGSAKILENMEIGHNVMHGQWDWMNNPEIHSSTWDWDTASTKEAWKHSHNYIHHTYTNIRGKDKDLGYEIMRIDPHQPWHPVYLLQPFYNVLLMALFEWGVAVHDMDIEAIRAGEKPMEEVREDLKGIAGKARDQIVKDYIAFPALSGLIMGGIAAAGAVVSERRSSRPRLRKLQTLARRRRSPRDEVLAAFGDRVQAQLPLDLLGRHRREHDPQLLVERDHLLRPLPRPDVHVLRGGGRGRDEGRLVRPPATRRGEHRGLGVLSRRLRQPRLPGRAPPLSRHALDPLRRDRAEGARRLQALRPALQHRAVLEAVGLGAADDPATRLPRRQGRGRSPARTGAATPKPRLRRSDGTGGAPSNGAGGANGAGHSKPAATENAPAEMPDD